MEDRLKDLKLLAYHEAGHTIAALVLGSAFESVSIVEDEESWGRSCSPLPENFDPNNEGADEIMEEHLVVSVAGAAAEELLVGELPELTGNDLENAAMLVMELVGSPEQTEAKSEEAFDKARAILRQNWNGVRALAEALLEHRELSRDGVLVLFEEVET